MKIKLFLMAIFFLLVLIAVSIYFLVRIQLGENPKGERLKNCVASENYNNGFFQNSVETSMDFPFWDVIKESMKKGEDRIPTKAIETVPISIKAYEEKDLKVIVTWLGHSTILLKINNKTILIDPVFSERASFSNYIGPRKFDYTIDYYIDSLPNIDLVLLTHDHYDHLDCQAIQQLKHKVELFVMPLGVGAHLDFWGVEKDKIKELDWWESLNFSGVEFTATPTRHFTGRGLKRFKTLWCGWAIQSTDAKIFFSGDSGYFNGFKSIGDKLGPFDLAFIECGQYSKFWSTIHLMPEESVQVAQDLGAKVAIPIHWAKFKLSTHSWFEPAVRFIQKAEQVKQKLAVPKIGQTFSLDAIPELNNWFNPL
jgi:L-ascorbate metabolism protein UlaG (beta-lactamase superfamily)